MTRDEELNKIDARNADTDALVSQVTAPAPSAPKCQQARKTSESSSRTDVSTNTGATLSARVEQAGSNSAPLPSAPTCGVCRKVHDPELVYDHRFVVGAEDQAGGAEAFYDKEYGYIINEVPEVRVKMYHFAEAFSRSHSEALERKNGEWKHRSDMFETQVVDLKKERDVLMDELSAAHKHSESLERKNGELRHEVVAIKALADDFWEQCVDMRIRKEDAERTVRELREKIAELEGK